MNLPPMGHADATTLASQLKLMGAGWWDMIALDALPEARNTVAAALIYMADYAAALEERLAELLELNRTLSGMLESAIAHPSSRVHPAEKIVELDGLPTNGAVWTGKPADYWNNQEAVHRSIVDAFFAQAPSCATCGMPIQTLSTAVGTSTVCACGARFTDAIDTGGGE